MTLLSNNIFASSQNTASFVENAFYTVFNTNKPLDDKNPESCSLNPKFSFEEKTLCFRGMLTIENSIPQ